MNRKSQSIHNKISVTEEPVTWEPKPEPEPEPEVPPIIDDGLQLPFSLKK